MYEVESQVLIHETATVLEVLYQITLSPEITEIFT